MQKSETYRAVHRYGDWHFNLNIKAKKWKYHHFMKLL
jgi:hypothetical protein